MTNDLQELRELVHACIDPGTSEAWQKFVQRFHKLIAGVVMRTAARWGDYSPDSVDDLVQDIYLKLCADDCRVLRDFHNQHAESIYGYLKVIAASVTNNFFRDAHAQKRGGRALIENLDDVQDLTERRQSDPHLTMDQHILLHEVDSCLQRCTAGKDGERDRLIFRLYYRQGLSAKAIASLAEIGLSIKGVESAILRITRLVRQELSGAGDSSLNKRLTVGECQE